MNHRTGPIDRRRTPRLSSPGRRAGDIMRLAFVTGCLTIAASKWPLAQTEPIRFGVDANAARAARERGVPLSYGSLWAGAWNQRYGWGDIRTQLRAVKDSGVTPVVQWWYWGDDISPSCLENGCTDRYHGVRKDRETWTRLSNDLADMILASGNQSAIVIIETEFNKQGVETYEPFDAYLAEQEQVFRRRRLSTVVGFGNWGYQHWTNFDRAVAGADYLGMMVMQSSVRDASTYLNGADLLIRGATRLHNTFGKPVFVTDVAFSSYPEPAYGTHQDTVVKSIFKRTSELRAAGVRGMLWRMLSDDPNFDTRNYHGIAERHWGLLRADGSEKPAFTTFRHGVAAEADWAQPAMPAPARPTSGSWYPPPNARR